MENKTSSLQVLAVKPRSVRRQIPALCYRFFSSPSCDLSLISQITALKLLENEEMNE